MLLHIEIQEALQSEGNLHDIKFLADDIFLQLAPVEIGETRVAQGRDHRDSVSKLEDFGLQLIEHRVRRHVFAATVHNFGVVLTLEADTLGFDSLERGVNPLGGKIRPLVQGTPETQA